jgi:hypothetical protein
VQTILNQAANSIYLKEGKLYTKVSRLEKDESYVVKTPFLVAAVRGTAFMVSTSTTEDVVAVKEGKVAVTRTNGAGTEGETILTEGQSAVFPGDQSKKIERHDLDKEESQRLGKVSSIEFIPKIATASDEEIEKVWRQIVAEESIDIASDAHADRVSKEDLIKQIIANKPKSIQDIREAFGHIDEITLYSGQVIRGAILSRGDVDTVLTTDGVIKVSADDIKQSLVAK